jgi:hypothetical protein
MMIDIHLLVNDENGATGKVNAIRFCVAGECVLHFVANQDEGICACIILRDKCWGDFLFLDVNSYYAIDRILPNTACSPWEVVTVTYETAMNIVRMLIGKFSSKYTIAE